MIPSLFHLLCEYTYWSAQVCQLTLKKKKMDVVETEASEALFTALFLYPDSNGRRSTAARRVKSFHSPNPDLNLGVKTARNGTLKGPEIPESGADPTVRGRTTFPARGENIAEEFSVLKRKPGMIIKRPMTDVDKLQDLQHSLAPPTSTF